MIKQLLGKDDSQKLTPSETTALVFAFSRPVEGLDMKIHLKQSNSICHQFNYLYYIIL